MKRKTSVKIIALLAVIVLLFSGCTVRGGGRLLDARQIRYQSTFGINAAATMVEPRGDQDVETECIPEFEVCGHFTYFDKQERMKVLGEVEGLIALDVDPFFGAFAMVEGTYVNHCGVTGPACIFLYDSQRKGWDRNSYDPCGGFCEEFKPDRVGITLKNKCGDVIYQNCAPLDRGNIKICAPTIDLCDDCR